MTSCARNLRILTLLMLALALVATQMMLSPLASARADGDRKQKEQEKASVDDQLEDLRIELSDVNSDLADTYLDLAETELKIPDAQKALEKAKSELSDAEDEDEEIGDRLADAKAEEADLSGRVDSGRKEVDASDEQVDEVSLAAYKGGGLPDPTSVYVGSANPQDAVDRSMNYKLTLEAQGTRLDDLRTDQSVTENAADRLDAVRAEIDDLKKESEAAVARKEKAKTKAQDAKDTLDDLYATQKKQADALEKKKEKYKDDQADLEDRSSALDSEISDLIKEEKEKEAAARRAAAAKKSSSGSSGSSGALSTPVSKSGWLAPSNARRSSPFGWRVHPIYHTRKLHAGMDFAAACGSAVKATKDGTVLATTSNSSAGNKLIVGHGTSGGHVMTSSYHHLQRFAVSTGQHVKQGQTIAYVGTTGSSTGCHLHFEIHEDGTAVNPVNYIG
jgi:murein DD-endopeptidase MepM/ murein hydrolase activator NlpD